MQPVLLLMTKGLMNGMKKTLIQIVWSFRLRRQLQGIPNDCRYRLHSMKTKKLRLTHRHYTNTLHLNNKKFKGKINVKIVYDGNPHKNNWYIKIM